MEIKAFVNKLIQGDCLKVMAAIPDESIDMVLSDLPYNVTDCEWDSLIDLDKYFEQVRRIIKPNGAILLTGTQPFTTSLNYAALDIYRYEWIWIKSRGTNFQLANSRPLRIQENVSVFYKHLPIYNPQGLIPYGKRRTRRGVKYLGDNWYSNNDYIGEWTNFPTNVLFADYDHAESLHPTQKPIILFEYLIKTYTNPGGIVLDTCAGSGTTGVACIKSNRKYILIELTTKYVNVIKERLQKYNDIEADTVERELF